MIEDTGLSWVHSLILLLFCCYRCAVRRFVTNPCSAPPLKANSDTSDSIILF